MTARAPLVAHYMAYRRGFLCGLKRGLVVGVFVGVALLGACLVTATLMAR